MKNDGPRRAGFRRLLAVGVAIVVMWGAPLPGLSASVDRRLENARGEVRALAAQIADHAIILEQLRSDLADSEKEITSAHRRLASLVGTQTVVHDAVQAAEDRYERAVARLNDIAIETYMYAPSGSAEAITVVAALGASSLPDLGDQLVYAESVGDAHDDVAADAAAARIRLEDRASALNSVLLEQTEVLGALERAEQSKLDTLAAEKQALADLEATRASIVALVARLRDRLRAQDVAAIADAFQGDAHVSYGEWAEAFLRIMDMPTCHSNLVAVVAWQVQEFTQAAWNPLATTHRMTGSTDFNEVGVQNFVSLEQGLQATKETIANGWEVYGYSAIIDALSRCADPMDTALAVNASRWCPGCGDGTYLLGVIPNVEDDYETYAAL
jgi:hypothetical protein